MLLRVFVTGQCMAHVSEIYKLAYIMKLWDSLPWINQTPLRLLEPLYQDVHVNYMSQKSTCRGEMFQLAIGISMMSCLKVQLSWTRNFDNTWVLMCAQDANVDPCQPVGCAESMEYINLKVVLETPWSLHPTTQSSALRLHLINRPSNIQNILDFNPYIL